MYRLKFRKFKRGHSQDTTHLALLALVDSYAAGEGDSLLNKQKVGNKTI
jgi:hypothetical protein